MNSRNRLLVREVCFRTSMVFLFLLVSRALFARTVHVRSQNSDSLTLATKQQAVQQAFGRLLAVSDTPKKVSYLIWPPQLEIVAKGSRTRFMSGNDPNAYAHAEGCVPKVSVTESLLSDILEYEPDRMAFVLGHELSHLLLGHVPCGPEAPTTPLIYAALSREQEYAADQNGFALALKAGYSGPVALQAFRVMDSKMGGSSFEALAEDHPSFKDRLAELDRQQANLWRSMSAFQNGVYLLAIQQYGPAADCFAKVTHDYPDASEAWLNLGYAQLMQYIDKLSADNIQAFGIGQLAVGGYYGVSATLQAKLRGIDRELWNQSLGSLGQAAGLDGASPLVDENLGLAYLVHPSGSPELDRAIPYLEQAAAKLQTANLAAINRIAILVNLAVAYKSAERDSQSQATMNQALLEYTKLADDSTRFYIASAIYYNLAAIGSDSKKSTSFAMQNYEQYLSVTNHNSPWWPMARQAYVQLCSLLNRPAKPEAQLQSPWQSAARPFVALEVSANQRITLGSPLLEARKLLGEGEEVPLAGDLQEFEYPDRGLALTGNDEVLAISLNGPNAPPLPWQAFGFDQQHTVLRVGMPVSELQRVLGAVKQYPAALPLLDLQSRFTYYPGLGLAVGTDGNSVTSFVIARIPLPSRRKT